MSYAAALPVIGYMPMPADFKYKSVFLHGKTQHGPDDPFRIRHPVMPCSRRAKLFSPFDALRGFDAAIWSKEVLYEDKKQLDESELEILNRKLALLHKLTYNSREERARAASAQASAQQGTRALSSRVVRPARGPDLKNQPVVTVTYFSPCADSNNFAYGKQGQYLSVTGVVRKVDPDISRTIILDDKVIGFSDISDISGALFSGMDDSL